MSITLLETGNVAVREFFIAGRLGNHRAGLLSIAMSCVIVLGVAWIADRWRYATTRGQQLVIGALWVVLTLSFGLMIARPDYNPLRLAFLFLAPLLAASLRRREKVT